MAKRKGASSETTEITPAQLAKALEGIAASTLAVRNLVLKLNPSCTVIVPKKVVPPKPRFWDIDCPPPE